MKPLGRKKVQLGSAKVDRHPPKGFINWWEDIAWYGITSVRMTQKQEIQDELDLLNIEKKK